MQGRSDVLRRSMDTLDVLEKANRFRYGLRERMRHLRLDRRDFAANLARNVARNEVVDLVDRRQLADRFLGELHTFMNQELLRELDDGAVRATYVLRRPALRAKPRDDLNDQIDLIRKQWIELLEALSGKLRQVDVCGEVCVRREAAAVLTVE